MRKNIKQINESFISKIMGAFTVNPKLETKAEIFQWFEEFDFSINQKAHEAAEKILTQKRS